MTQRIEYAKAAPGALRSLYEASRYLKSSTTLEPELLDLVNLRASQINGCAFCLAMHWREAKENGVSDDRLFGLPAWHEASWYSERERAALAWTESLTNVAQTHVPDDAFNVARTAFSERELVDLTLAVTTINAWNRFSIAFRTPPESAADVIASMKSAVAAHH
ncbi:MAG TPA: carboxymuconolactone decarboxylase family protein [Acidobacteriaceae bacterium]|jgi:AhpD family alkylhydroperoxidase|nr:carboxymuconolactone decarboxylase family protein [Acidobacteriaceae bacterium]